MKNIKFASTKDRCLHCGKKLIDVNSKFCSEACHRKYNQVKK